MMSSDSDWEFIFDGVFGFLSSPLWTVPIISFIESESTVFEATEENHLAWTEVHNKYKHLVESLLECYLKDIGITEEQFLKACVSSSAEKVSGIQNVLEQIYAADKFEIFKRMMVQRNLELQLEALEMIQKRQGTKKQEEKPVIVTSEDQILAEVLKRSEMEYKEAQTELLNSPCLNTSSASKAVEYNPKIEAQIVQQEKETLKLKQEVFEKQEDTKQLVNEMLEYDNLDEKKKLGTQATTLNISDNSLNSMLESDLANKELDVLTSKDDDISNIHDNSNIALKSYNRTTADTCVQAANREEKRRDSQLTYENKSTHDIEKRTEYLKQQRDRLLALKKVEREKQLTEYTKGLSATPKSENFVSMSQNITTDAICSSEDSRKIALRKALAAKLKKEVLHR